MKIFNLRSFSFTLRNACLCLGFCLGFSLMACGEDSSSAGVSPINPPDISTGDILSSSGAHDLPQSQAGSSSISDTPESSSSLQTTVPASSSSKKQETVSTEEILNEPLQLVAGSCGPTPNSISKGEIATWSFFRSTGDVMDQIMAPFVWTFNDGKVLKGNGLNEVNLTYENSGTYNASLNVDGNEIVCAPLQVQGVPINVVSCVPDKVTANVGEQITWTVVAESESNIVGYFWSTDFEGAAVVENGESASMTAVSSMHKQKVAPIVMVANEDKTVQNYNCEPASIVDPNQVDLVIAHSNADSSKAFPSGETIVAQYPPNAVNCQMVCGANGNGVILVVDGEEFIIDYSLNITPKSCTDGKAAGHKISVTASMSVLCYAT